MYNCGLLCRRKKNVTPMVNALMEVLHSVEDDNGRRDLIMFSIMLNERHDSCFGAHPQ